LSACSLKVTAGNFLPVRLGRAFGHGHFLPNATHPGKGAPQMGALRSKSAEIRKRGKFPAKPQFFSILTVDRLPPLS
jgi:hypothetical protein